MIRSLLFVRALAKLRRRERRRNISLT
jgi:hypothetical protein